ncbi:MAG: peptide MFS transporter, partial [Deltaproteobacteria bacterium]|nr:peptide MFS transporter [Deltaproteobacteria bacterium]
MNTDVIVENIEKVKHPKGLATLFMVEMWERFSYYGMRALLVPYLVFKVITDDGSFSGRGWSEADAMHLYGTYTGLAYLFLILGGVIADRLIGTHRSMVVGAVLITLGHLVLAMSGFGTLAFDNTGLALFITGLALIVLGTGHFKPCVSVMVGQLYKDNEAGRDGGFSIFYMGINVGAALSAFVCGTLGEKVGWHAGFGAAAVGMLLGLVTYFIRRPKTLEGIGLAPVDKPDYSPYFLFGSIILSSFFGLFYFFGGLKSFLSVYDSLLTVIPGYVLVITALLGVVFLSGWFIKIQEAGERGAVVTVLVFIFFNALFWMGFEQAGSTLNLFARDNTDRMIGSFEMPFTWFQSVNPILIVLLAPLFAVMWGRLGLKGKNPSQSLKIAMGLTLLGAGYIVMVFAGSIASTGVKVGMGWLALTYALHTMGELCLSPTG